MPLIHQKIVSGAPKGFEEIKIKAQNLPEAIGMVSKKQNRKLFFGHTKLIIIGENLLKDKDKLSDFLDWLDREPLKNRSSFIVATKDIENIPEVTPKLEKFVAPYIIGIIENQSKVATMINVSLSIIQSENKSPSIPSKKAPGTSEALTNDKVGYKSVLVYSAPNLA